MVFPLLFFCTQPLLTTRSPVGAGLLAKRPVNPALKSTDAIASKPAPTGGVVLSGAHVRQSTIVPTSPLRYSMLRRAPGYRPRCTGTAPNSPRCAGVTNSSDGCFSANRSCCACCGSTPAGGAVVDLFLHQRGEHPTGQMALQVTLLVAVSRPTTLVRPITPCLGRDIGRLAHGTDLAMHRGDIGRSAPSPWRAFPGSARRVLWNTDDRLMAIIASQRSTGNSSTVATMLDTGIVDTGYPPRRTRARRRRTSRRSAPGH